MPLSKEDLQHFKSLLLQRRETISAEARTLEDASRDKEIQGTSADRSTYSMHMADHGTDAMEREKSMLLAQREVDYVDDIDEALQRIEDGTYGICRVTGKDIAKARLEAVPTTSLSVEGKMKEKEQAE
jgi:DnaK suppressor protein